MGNGNELFFKALKISMELNELYLDSKRLLQLCNFGNAYPISLYIDSIARKYRLETAVYHATHYMPPTNLQGRIQNCMNFLEGLIQAKKVELTLEAVKEVNNA